MSEQFHSIVPFPCCKAPVSASHHYTWKESKTRKRNWGAIIANVLIVSITLGITVLFFAK